MSTPYPQQTPLGYMPQPVYGQWKPWLQAAIGLFLINCVTQFVQSPKVALVGGVASIGAAACIWRMFILSRDEGRARRADAEELETGARPYGILPPVFPAKAYRRPKFWVMVGVPTLVAYGAAAAALLAKTAHKSNTKYSGSAASGYSFDAPVTYDMSILALVSTGSVILGITFWYFIIQTHLRITECVDAPIGWWDGDGAGYADPFASQYTPQPVTGYDANPAYAQPAPSSGDALADMVSNLSDEDFDRLRRHFSGADATDEQPATRDADDSDDGVF